jgi:rhodanese-related sulfurtransferase
LFYYQKRDLGKKVFVVGGGMAHAGCPIPLKDKIIQSETSGRPGAVEILREALVVLAAGIAFALAANQVSPRGLVLTRNYFPAGAGPSTSMSAGAGSSRQATNSLALSPAELLAARLREQGLQLVDGRQAALLFRDPRFQQGRIVFIDARDETHYHEGHIPGACEFDPYYPEKYFTAVLPVCQAAEQIVVYCHGGDCDDSESAAITLRDVGIAINKLFIYGGGITEWATNGLPIETGMRNSGKLRNLDK